MPIAASQRCLRAELATTDCSMSKSFGAYEICAATLPLSIVTVRKVSQSEAGS